MNEIKTREPARIGGAIAGVIVAGLTILGASISPEYALSIEVFVVAAVELAVVSGIAEWVRSRVSPV